MLGIRCCVTLSLYVGTEGGQRGLKGGPGGVLHVRVELESGVRSQRLAAELEKESLMKLLVDTSSKQVSVTKEATEKLEQNGRQKVERGTGRPMWSTQVFVLDDDGGEVITITTAGEKPDVKVRQLVVVSKLEALPWATNGRNGVAFRAEEIKTAPGLSSVKTG
jgi:hypothetical protein